MSESTTASATNPYVIEPMTQTFEHDVIERSRTVPVVVDFWADWCGPCKLLGPVLEKLAGEYAGKFILAKVDTERNQELALQFGVRSIPIVFGFRDGKIGRCLRRSPARGHDSCLARPAVADAGRVARRPCQPVGSAPMPHAAEEKYNIALSLDPDLTAAQIGLARIALEQGRLEDAAARIARMERRGFLEPDAEKLKAELTLRLQAQNAGGVETARAALAANPDDLDLKFQLAEALAAGGQYADALALCLDLVERDRKGVGEQARQTMIAIFQLLPPNSDLVTEYQRQLSMALME